MFHLCISGYQDGAYQIKNSLVSSKYFPLFCSKLSLVSNQNDSHQLFQEITTLPARLRLPTPTKPLPTTQYSKFQDSNGFSAAGTSSLQFWAVSRMNMNHSSFSICATVSFNKTQNRYGWKEPPEI